jgi:hypothetical protein
MPPWSASGGTWEYPGNILSSDDSYANVPGNAGYTCILFASNFNLGIPSGATIDGVEVRIEKRRGGSEDIVDAAVGINDSAWGGETASSNYADTSTNWSSSDTYTTYGGPTNLWGLVNLTPDTLNSTTLGVVFRARNIFVDYGSTPYVDNIQMKVYYTENLVTPVIGQKYMLPAFRV